ncbi:TPA_asm: L polymerase [Bombay duck fish bornavirus]|uniref:RNA-directed RNA polymerase n=1 Tax=Bombay duck fish bornavirus TaxID=3067899 RepID=A0AA48SG54_9MONO|nr:TPA_asm: L polymerase [Bombay duck fish bornavirus]
MAHRSGQVLSSPLLGTEVKLALTNSTNPSHLHFRSMLDMSPLHPSNCYYPFFLRHHSPSGTSVSDLSSAASRIWDVVSSTWKCCDTLRGKVLRSVPLILSNDLIRSTLEKHLDVQALIQSISYSTNPEARGKLGGVEVRCVQSLVLCKTTKEQCAMTYNHLLAYADTMRSRVHLLIAALVEDILGKYRVSQIGECSRFLAHADRLALSSCHDDYFGAIKSVYPYAQGRVLHFWNNEIEDKFYEVTRQAVSPLGHEFLSRLDYLAQGSPEQCLEIFSVQKCFFFPEINLDEGVEQQFERMRRQNSEPSAQAAAGHEVLWMFRKEYIRGHVRKHGKWPNCTVKRKAPSLVKQSRLNGDWPVDDVLDYRVFKHVQLEYQGEGVEYEPDISDIITDKAIIETRSHWPYEYNAWAYSDKYHSRLQRSTEGPGTRRLIKAMLDGKLEDIPAMLRPFEGGEINTSALITVLVPKEKELKVKGRFFSKQSLETRIYQVLSELTLKKKVMVYLPFHSMTTGSTQLSHVLDKISNQILEKSAFVINLDFEGWCNTFRPEFQDPLCTELDRMFQSGNFFRVGSLLPLVTTYLIQDRFNPPKQGADGYPVEDGKTCLHGTLTMGEGMRQKLWTILTGCMELIVLERLRIRGEVLGQGDNQTLVIHTRPNQDKNLVRDRVVSSLKEFALKCGLILKPEECWSSDVLYEYGKKMYFRGSQVSNFLKIFSRITDSTGELYPNVYARLACLSSSCLAASQADHTPWPSVIASIVVYCLEVRVLLPRSIWGNVDRLVALALVGPMIGGLPSPAVLPSVFFRGMSDQLTFQLSLLRTAVLVGASKAEIHRIAKLRVPHSPSPQALVVDPTCLNISQVRRPERVIRSWIEEGLSEMNSSSRLAKLFQLDLTGRALTLATDLYSMSPKFPRLMSYIFSLSNVAYGLSMLDKFQKSSTVMSINQAVNLPHIVDESRNYKDLVVDSILSDNESTLSILDFLGPCSYKEAEALRFRTWGEHLTGATAPFPGEQFTMKEAVTPEEVRRSIIFVVPEDVRPTLLISRGEKRLYLGSRTFVKITKGAITGLPAGKLGTMSEALVALWDWMRMGRRVPGERFNKILLVLMKEKGITPPDAPVISGGTLTHRLPSSSDDRSCLAGSINMISTRVSFTTDYMADYAKSSDDYTLHFQAAFLYGLNILASKAHGGCLKKGTYYLVMNCPSCTNLIEEGAFSLTREPSYSGVDLELLPIFNQEVHPEVPTDPIILATKLLGQEVGKSIALESRGLTSLLDSGQSPMKLERISLSHVRPLHPKILILSIWSSLESERVSLERICPYLRLVACVPSHSSTIRWLTRALYSMDDYCQLSELFKLFEITPSRCMTSMSPRESMITMLILEGLSGSSKSARVRRTYRQEALAGSTSLSLDAAMALAKAETSYVAPYIEEPKATIEYELSNTTCQDHRPSPSIPLSVHSALSRHLKALVSLKGIEVLVVSKETPPEVVVDLCHITKVVIHTQGSPEPIEVAREMDLCEATKRNLLTDVSLSSISCASHYYSHLSPHPPGAYRLIDNGDLLPYSPCGTIGTHCIGTDSGPVDLSDMVCKPPMDEYCESLVPRSSNVVESCLKNAESIMNGLNDLMCSNSVVITGLSELRATGPTKTLLVYAIEHLHRNLEIIRAAFCIKPRRVCNYYICSTMGAYHLNLHPPGYRVRAECIVDVIVPRAFGLEIPDSISPLIM